MVAMERGGGTQPTANRRERVRILVTCGIVWYLSSMVAFAGGWFSVHFVPVTDSYLGERPLGFGDRWFAWDGEAYLEIAESGYQYQVDTTSNVNFFPLFPLIARAVGTLTQLPPRLSMLCVSNACLLASLGGTCLYLRGRFPELRGDEVLAPIVLLAIFPTSFFFRAAYSESLFLLLIVTYLVGCQRRWPMIGVAGIVGLATATRSVGLALIVPFLAHVYQSTPQWPTRIRKGALLLPICLSGFLAYLAYLYFAFGDPLAYFRASRHYVMRDWGPSVGYNVAALITLEPIRSVYTPTSLGYWGRFRPTDAPVFNLQFWNPVVFLGTLGLVVFGRLRKWVNMQELIMSLSLLGVPYALNGYRSCMAGQARYALVVLPAYWVLAKLLSGFTPLANMLAVLVLATALFAFTTLFCSWYWFT